MEDFERDVISITDEDGVEYELEVLSTVVFNGVEYLALTPADADEDEETLEVSILKSVTENGEPVLLAVEDEKELEAVYDLLMEENFGLDVGEYDEDEESDEDEEF